MTRLGVACLLFAASVASGQESRRWNGKSLEEWRSHALDAKQHTAIIRVLHEVFREGEHYDRFSACLLISEMGPAAKPLAPDLIALLLKVDAAAAKDPLAIDMQFNWVLAHAFRAIGLADANVIATFLAIDRAAPIRERTFESAASALCPNAAPILLSMMASEKNEQLRLELLRTLRDAAARQMLREHTAKVKAAFFNELEREGTAEGRAMVLDGLEAIDPQDPRTLKLIAAAREGDSTPDWQAIALSAKSSQKGFDKAMVLLTERRVSPILIRALCEQEFPVAFTAPLIPALLGGLRSDATTEVLESLRKVRVLRIRDNKCARAIRTLLIEVPKRDLIYDDRFALLLEAVTAAESFGTEGKLFGPCLLELWASASKPHPREIGRALGTIAHDPKAILTAFEAAIRADAGSHRTGALIGLGRLGPLAKPALPLLVTIARRNRSESRRAFRALGSIGPAAADAIPDLIQLLHAELSPEDHKRVVWTVGAIGTGAAAAVPTLRALLIRAPASGMERWWYARALGKIGVAAQPAAPEILRLARQPRIPADVRGILVRAYSGVGKDATALAIELVEDDGCAERELGIEICREIGHGATDALPALRKIAARDLYYLRPLAQQAILEISK